MSLSLTVCEINGDFSRKLQNFPTLCRPLFLTPRLKGSDTLELGIGAWSPKTRIMGYRAEKEVWRYLQPSGYNTPTWQTDGQMDSGRQQDLALTHSVARLKSRLTWLPWFRDFLLFVISCLPVRCLRTLSRVYSARSVELSWVGLGAMNMAQIFATPLQNVINPS